MSDLVVRDHSQPCEHEEFSFQNGWGWACVVCPGGREITLRRQCDLDCDDPQICSAVHVYAVVEEA